MTTESMRKVICDYIDANGGNENYEEILKNDKRYYVWDTFSDQRQAAIKWYPFDHSAKVLEIDAGYGAVTGALCDELSFVVAYESNEKAAAYLRKRYRNRNNLLVVSCANELAEYEKNFDYVVFWNNDETVLGKEVRDYYIEKFLRIRKYINENTIILWAVNNKYGIRHLCGESDNSTGVVFDSVANYPNYAKGKALSLNEIKDIVKNVGFNQYQVFYPFIDSHMPRTVYSQKHMPDETIGERVDTFYSSPSFMIADDKALYSATVANNAFDMLTNSYIVEMTNMATLSDVKYVTLSPQRGRNKSFAVIIRDSEVVEKKCLYRDGHIYAKELCTYVSKLKERNLPILEMTYCDGSIIMPYIDSRTVFQYIEILTKECRKEEILNVFDKLWEYVLQSSDYTYSVESSWGPEESNVGPVLKNAFVELIPLNSFWVNGDFLFFDQEYVYDNVPAKYIMYRGVNICLTYISGLSSLISRREFQERYAISDKLWKIFIDEDVKFINEVNPLNVPNNTSSEMRRRANRYGCSYETAGKRYKVGYTPGVYDLFHVGHLNLIRKSKEQCEYLIVGVLTDELVMKYKGKAPVIPLAERKAILESIKYIDEVVVVDYHNTDKIDAWKLYKYDCHFSGDDHMEEWLPVQKQLRELGSDMVFFEYTEGTSSTKIKGKLENDS